MRLVIIVLVLLTMYLQYGLWYTRGGKHDVEKLKVSVEEQKGEIARLKERNRSLAAEVMDLKQGLEAIEERARSEMGMIKSGEVFFRITDPNREHDQPQSASSLAKAAETPLEPPLDPLAPGDAALNDAPPSPPPAEDKAMAAKPLAKAIVGAAAAKSAATAKGGGMPAAKPAPASNATKPVTKAAPKASTVTPAAAKPLARPAAPVRPTTTTTTKSTTAINKASTPATSAIKPRGSAPAPAATVAKTAGPAVPPRPAAKAPAVAPAPRKAVPVE